MDGDFCPVTGRALHISAGLAWPWRWGPAASLGLHAVLLAVLVLAVPQRDLAVAPVKAVTVELVASPPQEAESAGPSALQSGAGAPDAAPVRLTGGGPIVATHMQAATILAQHPNVRETLPLLADEERMVQLCAIEAIEQINQWRPEAEADTLVAYAFGTVERRDHTLTAEGGAYRSHRAWYRVGFTCAVAGDFASVTRFSFTPGEKVPEAEWEAHDLTAAEVE